MTLSISGTLINGMLFGIYTTIVIIIIMCNTLDKTENKLTPILSIIIAFTWPISIPLGLISIAYLNHKNMWVRDIKMIYYNKLKERNLHALYNIIYNFKEFYCFVSYFLIALTIDFVLLLIPITLFGSFLYIIIKWQKL